MKKRVFAALAAGMLTSNAYGAVVTFDYTGVFQQGTEAGTPFTVELLYDDAMTPGGGTTATSAQYGGSFGALSAAFAAPSMFFATVSRNDQIDSVVFRGRNARVIFSAAPGSVLSGVELPTAVQLARFQRVTVEFNLPVNGQAHTGYFDSAEVPEPATWAMMISGFALAGAVARRRTKVACA